MLGVLFILIIQSSADAVGAASVCEGSLAGTKHDNPQPDKDKEIHVDIDDVRV